LPTSLAVVLQLRIVISSEGFVDAVAGRELTPAKEGDVGGHLDWDSRT